MSRIASRLLLGFVLSLTASAFAQNSVQDLYTKREEMIQMRDGVKLFTSIYIPKDASQSYPLLMSRTPYSCRPYGPDQYRNSLGPEASFTQDLYIFVYQDVRGRYMSEGDFNWMNPYKPNKRAGETDETTDTWDTIEWLMKNVPNNNGRVGMYGTSYPGHYTAQGLIDPHPALKAATPQAPMADNWLGDDMHHNGAFFLPHAMNFIAGFGKKRDGPTQNYGPRVFSHGTRDGYQFFLEMGPLPNANKLYLKDQIELWNLWMKHGDYDEYWQAQNVPQHLKRVTPAVLTVGGWFDAEDLYGPLAIYKAIEQNNPRADNTIVMGPWYHGSWNGGPGDALHDIKWEVRTGEYYRQNLQKPFFEKHLKGKAEVRIPEATMFDTGLFQFREFQTWPPNNVRTDRIYFQANGGLGFGAPREQDAAYDEYLSDPAKPVPNSATITTGMARSYMLEDQRFVANRPDVLVYETEPLTDNVTLAGPLTATLYVSTTGTDADFIVKLIDVFPNDYAVASPRDENVPMGGYQMMVRGEPMRAKYRNSWSKPEPLVPGQVTKVEFVLPDVYHTFKRGHKIMVQVHSTWFPLIDRNPQKFVNIYEAKESDFQKATHRIYRTASSPSHLVVNVLQ